MALPPLSAVSLISLSNIFLIEKAFGCELSVSGMLLATLSVREHRLAMTQRNRQGHSKAEEAEEQPGHK